MSEINENTPMPWCWACRSYHVATNPTCYLKVGFPGKYFEIKSKVLRGTNGNITPSKYGRFWGNAENKAVAMNFELNKEKINWKKLHKIADQLKESILMAEMSATLLKANKKK
jgi:hypothetical protein